jgi:hypothetical protein
MDRTSGAAIGSGSIFIDGFIAEADNINAGA